MKKLDRKAKAILACQVNEQANKRGYSLSALISEGYSLSALISEGDKSLWFIHNKEMVTYWPYSGWASGKTIKDGRGLDNLLKQLK